jgi:hypothetical protein
MLIHVTFIHVKTTVKTCQYQGNIYGRSSIFERKSQRVSGFSFPLNQSCADNSIDCYHPKGYVRLLEMHYRIDQPCNIRRITMRGEQSSLRAKRATHVSWVQSCVVSAYPMVWASTPDGGSPCLVPHSDFQSYRQNIRIAVSFRVFMSGTSPWISMKIIVVFDGFPPLSMVFLFTKIHNFHPTHDWLVVWNIWIIFPIILGMS